MVVWQGKSNVSHPEIHRPLAECPDAIAAHLTSPIARGPGAIVLCGGQSQRMGREKYRLPIGKETLLQRICRLASTVASPVVVSAASAQDLPAMGNEVIVLRDVIPDQGPLPAVARALRWMAQANPPARFSFVLSCDVPLISVPVLSLLAEHITAAVDVVVVCDQQHDHPLCAVYRIAAWPIAEQLVLSGERRMREFLGQLRVQRLTESDIRAVDPGLGCLQNVNTVDDYDRVLQMIQLPG